MTWFHWLVSTLALVGVLLNIKKKAACFGIWAFTNLSWTFIDLNHGLIAQAALQYIYFLLSLYGLQEWLFKRERRKPEEASDAEKR